jgi:hypothetical protein
VWVNQALSRHSKLPVSAIGPKRHSFPLFPAGQAARLAFSELGEDIYYVGFGTHISLPTTTSFDILSSLPPLPEDHRLSGCGCGNVIVGGAPVSLFSFLRRRGCKDCEMRTMEGKEKLLKLGFLVLIRQVDTY